MTNSQYSILLANGFPEKFINYLSTGFHFEFEKADNREDIEVYGLLGK